jgi:translation initiation factor IF-2
MCDHNGKTVTEAGPSTPVKIVGLTQVPMSGDAVCQVDDEKMAKEVIRLRLSKMDKEVYGFSRALSMQDLLDKVSSEEMLSVSFILKADAQGSVEAIAEAIANLKSKKVKANVIHKAVGGINESDLNLAQVSDAVILAFNVRASRKLDEEAETRGVHIKYFGVIYELVDTVKSIMAGVLPPITKEVIQGHAEVRQAFSVPKIGTVAGSAVIDGKILRNCQLRLIRDQIIIYSGKMASLRRFKDDVKEVQHGYECGISFESYNDIRVGDIIEAFMLEESKATLDI